uniref:FAR1 domain-containing protein n=1 Tax=Chenopodium quinoa TaxID=63459 RepID=A0A803LSP8_CHEQI
MYFRSYGKQEGFGVVCSSGATKGRGTNAKETRNMTWTCECFGLPGRKSKKSGSTFVSDSQISEEVCMKRKSKKVSCHVKLYAKVNEVGEWVIDKAVVDHQGHNPTPGKSKNITKFRQKFLMDNPHIVQQLLNDRKAGFIRTPSSVCLAKEKDSTTSTQGQGSCDGVQEVILMKDPPLPKRLAHRTTDSRYLILRVFRTWYLTDRSVWVAFKCWTGKAQLGISRPLVVEVNSSMDPKFLLNMVSMFRILNFHGVRFLLGCMDGKRLIHLYQLHQDKQGKFLYYLNLSRL